MFQDVGVSATNELNTLDCGRLLFSRDCESMPIVFIRLSRCNENGHHELLWQGFGDWCRQGDAVSCVVALTDKIHYMDWPELKQLFDWMSKSVNNNLRQLRRQQNRIRALVENLTLTIFCEGNLAVASGGFDRALEEDGDGNHFHVGLRARNLDTLTIGGGSLQKPESSMPTPHLVDTRMRLGVKELDIIVNLK